MNTLCCSNPGVGRLSGTEPRETQGKDLRGGPRAAERGEGASGTRGHSAGPVLCRGPLRAKRRRPWGRKGCHLEGGVEEVTGRRRHCHLVAAVRHLCCHAGQPAAKRALWVHSVAALGGCTLRRVRTRHETMKRTMKTASEVSQTIIPSLSTASS